MFRIALLEFKLLTSQYTQCRDLQWVDIPAVQVKRLSVNNNVFIVGGASDPLLDGMMDGITTVGKWGL